MKGRLQNKIAIVIGAGSIGAGWSNGKAAAVLYAREGASLFCIDISLHAAKETANIIRGEGGSAFSYQADASKTEDIKNAIDACLVKYGRIDVLHNNVGIVVRGGVVELAEEDWDRAFNVNLKSIYLSMKHAIPHMVTQGGGSIVNVSSIASLRYIGANYVGYYTSKAAINHLTRVTAAEFASKQVRINTVIPGMMDTPMARKSAIETHGVAPDQLDEAWQKKAQRIPIGWMGDAWDVAHAALFFASDESRFVTGAELVVDGGLTLKS
jgi:NAD(P)-dependent dehydrogenase (short-subunit alcohol dehydrogenase family)